MEKIIIFLCASFLLFSHQFFPIKDGENYKVVFWADGHWGEYQTQNIFGVLALDENGKKQKAGFDYANNKIVVEKDPAVLALHYDFGYFTFGMNGKIYPQRRDRIIDKDGGNIVAQTRRIYKIGKSIFSWNEKSNQPMGLRLEILPLQNPFVLKEGDKIRLQVLFEGKPIEGLVFEDQIDDIKKLKTDKDGIIELTLRKPQDGLQILGTSIKIKQLDKFADTLQISSTLSFKMRQ